MMLLDPDVQSLADNIGRNHSTSSGSEQGPHVHPAAARKYAITRLAERASNWAQSPGPPQTSGCLLSLFFATPPISSKRLDGLCEGGVWGATPPRQSRPWLRNSLPDANEHTIGVGGRGKKNNAGRRELHVRPIRKGQPF
jgi:hypothetical protein